MKKPALPGGCEGFSERIQNAAFCRAQARRPRSAGCFFRGGGGKRQKIPEYFEKFAVICNLVLEKRKRIVYNKKGIFRLGLFCVKKRVKSCV